MATSAYYISAFAAEDQREIPRTATTSYTGVFAQRERRSLTEVPLAPQQISVRLYAGAEPITLTYNTVESYAKKNPEKAALVAAGIGAALGAAVAFLMSGGKKGKKK